MNPLQCWVLWEISDIRYLVGTSQELIILLEAQNPLKMKNHARPYLAKFKMKQNFNGKIFGVDNICHRV